jgi:hypothetical protein
MALHKTKKDELAKRDLKLIQINEEIKNKKNLILRKKKEIEKKKSDNTYLEKVSKDYDIYHNYVLEQKQNEFKAMNILNEYMLDLLNTNKLFDNQLRLAKHDQKEITNEINKIKDEIEDIKNKIK